MLIRVLLQADVVVRGTKVLSLRLCDMKVK
jgi:hypothetical protein